MRLAEADPEATRHSEAGRTEEAQKDYRNHLSPTGGGSRAFLETSIGTRNTRGVITSFEPGGAGWDEITPKELFHSLPFACDDGAALLPLQEEICRKVLFESPEKAVGKPCS